MYTDFEELENGNLKITLNKRGKEELAELKERFEKIGYAIWWELNEGKFCNGYTEVKPEDIGALTSSPLIANGIIDEETTQEELDNTKVWFFPNYQVISEIEELFEKGEVIFVNADN